MLEEGGNLKVIGRYSYYTAKCLGQGSFGKVFEGFQNQTKQKVAIKQIQVKILEKDSYLQKSIESEIKVLSKFKHPNIVQLYQVLTSKKNLYIITEYCKHGDLRRYIKQRGVIPEVETYQALKQIACGFRELVKEKVIHRDLKPANILISDGLYKICDFGFAKYVNNMTEVLKSCVGSPIYMAPQILQKQKYNYKCDIWSLGIIYYEMLHGVVPWKGVSESDLMNNIRTVPLMFRNNISMEVQKFIRCLLTYSEADRLTWEEVFLFFGVANNPTPPQLSSNYQLINTQQQKQLEQLQKQQNQQVIGQQQKQQQKLIKFQQQQQQLKNTNEKQQLLHQQHLNQLQNGIFPNPPTPKNQSKKQEIKIKFLTRHHFEELALRYFVAVDIKTRVYKLRKFNFSKFLFQKIILLLSYSVRLRFEQFKSDIDKIHDPDSLVKIRKDQKSYNQFQQDLMQWFQQQGILSEIKKQPEIKKVIDRDSLADVSVKFDKLLIELMETAKRQITQFVSETEDASERNSLVTIFQNLCMVQNGNEQFNQLSEINIKELIKNRNEVGTRTMSRMSSTKQEKGGRYNQDLRFFS